VPFLFFALASRFELSLYLFFKGRGVNPKTVWCRAATTSPVLSATTVRYPAPQKQSAFAVRPVEVTQNFHYLRHMFTGDLYTTYDAILVAESITRIICFSYHQDYAWHAWCQKQSLR